MCLERNNSIKIHNENMVKLSAAIIYVLILQFCKSVPFNDTGNTARLLNSTQKKNSIKKYMVYEKMCIEKNIIYIYLNL